MIVIVSGLPRSGTSLMMDMLRAGGMPVLVDQVRRSDEHNPRGYFEYAPIKRLATDSSWITAAEGKAIKAVSLLLYSLPPGRDYRIVFMTRRFDEILASQNDMLAATGVTVADSSDIEARQALELHLAQVLTWVQSQSNMALLKCDYNQMLNTPMPILESVSRFLGIPLAMEQMRERIDMGLHRHCLGKKALAGQPQT